MVQSKIASQVTRGEIERRFTYQAPRNDAEVESYQVIRETAKAFAIVLAKRVPAGRSQDLALTKLEECVMHANAGIARGPE